MTINGLENLKFDKIKSALILFCLFKKKGLTDNSFFVDAKYQTDTDNNYLVLTDTDYTDTDYTDTDVLVSAKIIGKAHYRSTANTLLITDFF